MIYMQSIYGCAMQSFTKGYSTQLRYESLMRRHERLDDAMYYWSHQKYMGMADLLQEVRSVVMITRGLVVSS